MEYYKKQPDCNIQDLDSGAILSILSKAQCFSDAIKVQAAKVRDEVRHKFAHAILKEWTPDRLNQAFSEMKALAQLLPDSSALVKELESALTGLADPDFPMKKFLLKMDKYRNSIIAGKHEKVHERIQKLENIEGHEIFVERKFVKISEGRKGEERETDDEYRADEIIQGTSKVEDLVLEEESTLLKGRAGAGKSSVSAKTVEQWAEGNHLNDITCCLFLTSGSEKEIPMYKTVWDSYTEACNWTDEEFLEVYQHLQILAHEGKLAIIIDGLDEFGPMTKKDIGDASKAAIHPNMDLDLRTACVGILSKKILCGARVLATGRNTKLINSEILKNKANMWELDSLTQGDRKNMIDKMETDPKERERIEQELDRISTSKNAFFLKNPLMTKTIIQLCIEKKVDIEKVKNSAEIYLMVVMKNLTFHTDHDTNFTELDPPEDQEYLQMCFKMCQAQMQENVENVNTIEGMPRNIKNLGQCFEKKVFGETIYVPVDFIKKLGNTEMK